MSALHQLPKLCMSSIGCVCICVFGRRTVACVSSRSTWRQTPIPHRKRVDSSASTECGMFNIHICRFVVEFLATWSPQCAQDLSVCLDVAKIRLNVTDLSTQSRTTSKCKLMSPKWRINHLVTRSNVPGELSSKSPRLQRNLLCLTRHLVSRSCCGRTSVTLPMDPSAHCFAGKANNCVNNFDVTHIRK